MKNLILTIIVLFIGVVTFAQKDVTKFMGIPVDGFKPEMIQKLKAKGFTIAPGQKDILEGEFNGEDVNVYVVTNNNKVYRIMICDQQPRSAGDIRIRFNNLVSQFKRNERYINALARDYTLTEDEDIRHNITVSDKRYDAIFYQLSNQIDTLALQQAVLEKMQRKYTPEQLENPTEEITKDILTEGIAAFLESNSKRVVWFMISKHRYDEYYITMFYETNTTTPTARTCSGSHLTPAGSSICSAGF